MRSGILLDTGPLVAFLNRRERHHAWVRDCWRDISPPMLTSESVLSEAIFLVEQAGGDAVSVLELVGRGVIQPSFRLNENVEHVKRLIGKYSDVPMSLADACLVRMSELRESCTVFTLDEDFRLYRRNGRRSIPLLFPSSR